MTDFISPSEVRNYTRGDIMYFLNECRETWPVKDSNYTDAPVSHSASQHMPGETELLVRAEITQRISFCGDAGVRLYAEILRKGKERPVDYDDLSQESRCVVSYASGVCRKNLECSFCRKPFNPVTKKGCRSFGRKPCTFNQFISHNR